MREMLNEIDWKSLIFGAAFCAVIAMFGSSPGLEILAPFASVGLLYIGYKGKNLTYGTILGAIGAIPLFLVAMYGGLGSFTITSTTVVLILISCLIIGALLGFVGALFHKNYIKTKKAKEQREKNKKNKNKKK
ncbi:hypothetical protein [Methanobrevibacter woesei]|uniref:hypothetical protein n=1 Tax=Methanobrevibacter woesei TaxID=190976 RepID=UPI0026DF8F04|nr:hypothetical protein [Methanobrevibacter woesei]